MYFKNKDTYEKNKKCALFNKYKIYIFISLGIVILFVFLMVMLFFKNDLNVNVGGDNSVTFTLLGDREVSIYVGEEYVEPGYYANDKDGNDVTNDVSVTTNLDVNKTGEYKIIYKYDDYVVERYVYVIEGVRTEININLNGATEMYLLLGEKYVEPGYNVVSNMNITSDDVLVSGDVNTLKQGEYKLIYSVKDDNGVDTSVFRTVIVMDLNVSFEYNKEYTNKDVSINYSLDDEYLDYLLLPDNTRVSNNSGIYSVSKNGEYKFIVYGNGGRYKENILRINNIDNVLPTGNCSIYREGSNTILSINASDNVGIDKYVYNGNIYKDNKIKISNEIDNARVIIYDTTGNSSEMDCVMIPNVYVNNLSKDGVIVNVNAYEFINKVSGYYFSYNNKRPDKNSGGYIATSQNNIEVVRLPGTTYVWVEDNKGNISDYKTIVINNSDIHVTTGSTYKLLQNERLDDFLSKNGSSITELNNLITRSVLASGLYSREAVATSAMSLQLVLAQRYKIRIPYFNGGKSYSIGAKGEWGSYKYGVDEYRDKEYFYDGLDCMGFVSWAYVNAGYDIYNSDNKYGGYFDSWWYKSVGFVDGEIGDVLVNNDNRNIRHVKLIIGKSKTAYITAEATSAYDGMVISTHPFDKPNNYKVEKSNVIMNDYNKLSRSKFTTN